LATHSSHKRPTSTSRVASSLTSEQVHAADLLLLERLLAHLPVGLLVNDAHTLEVVRAKPPLPGLADRHLPLDQRPRISNQEDDVPDLSPELASRIQQVAATGTPQHLPEFRHEPPGGEPRWWSASLQRVDMERAGRAVVTLAIDLTDQVLARRLLTEQEQRHQALHQAIAAVSGHKLALSLPQVTDALVLALPIDVATLRLLDGDANLHLVAASGLRPAETRRLALEPITVQRLERIVEANAPSRLAALGLHSIQARWLEGREGRIGILTTGARSMRHPTDDDLALLEAAAGQLSKTLETIKRSARILRNRSLEIARLSPNETDPAQIQANDLRPRELAILGLYQEGLGTDQIAELLVLSPHTVRTHVRNARRRLNVNSRREALDLLETTDANPVI
jgi:DNA-binding CsgD family transcriptional regulator